MIKPWKILSSRQTYKDPWLSVRTDHVQLDDGREIEDYHILEYSDWVTVIGLTSSGNVVLIREYRHGANAVTIGLPSGRAEADEHTEDVAKREFLEETGYTAQEWVKIGQGYANWGTQNNKVHYYIAFNVEKSDQQHLDENEEIETFEWSWQRYFEHEDVHPENCLHLAALYYAERYFAKHPDKRPQSA